MRNYTDTKSITTNKPSKEREQKGLKNYAIAKQRAATTTSGTD
jgi:hypothetical protein